MWENIFAVLVIFAGAGVVLAVGYLTARATPYPKDTPVEVSETDAVEDTV